jgi:hypothetical protein
MDTNTPDPNKETREKKDNEEAQLRMSFGHVFSGIHGEAVLSHLKSKYGWFTKENSHIERSLYHPGMSVDAMAYGEGQKNVIRYILGRLVPVTAEKQPNK